MNAIIFLILSVIVATQSAAPDSKSACEERAQQVMRTLEPSNMLRHALENGQRGDCIHQPWMDTMRRFGIKHVSFLVEYSWKHDRVTFKVKSVLYFPTYYSWTDRPLQGRILDEIEKSGLKSQLISAVLARVEKGPFTVRQPLQNAKGIWEESLFDDEALPAFGTEF